jgi:general secretion pathway protein D
MTRVLSFLLAGLLAACAAPPRAIDEARALAAQGQAERAVGRLAGALAERPADARLRAEWVRQRDLTVAALLAQAEQARQARRADAARGLYERMLALHADEPRARAGLAALERDARLDALLARAEQAAADAAGAAAAETLLRALLAEQPGHAAARRALARLRERQATEALADEPLRLALATPISLELRDTPLRNAFDVIARTAPLNFVFDRDVRAEQRVSINVRSSPVEDVIRLLLATQALDSKVLNANSLLIYPDTPAKQREHRELTTRLFYLVNADAKAAQALLRSVGKIRELHVDERLNLLAVRDTPDAVRLAERLVAGIDLAEPEVMLEVEVLEVTRTRLRDLGIRFPSQLLLEQTLPLPGTVPAGRINLNQLSGSQLAATIANPALRLGLQSDDTDVNLLANPRIRAKNREKARVLIGEKLPVFTTTAVQNAGVAASVSYLDVGLKLEVEPSVLLDDEVSMRVNLEVNSNLERVVGPDGSTAFRLGTRSAVTALRLKDGETQVLAGLISDSERETLSRLPGLGDLPGIGRLFGNTNSSREKSEIVLLITPRVLRNVAPPELASLVVPAGTEAHSGARPLRIAATAPRGIGLAPAAGAGAPRAGAGAPAPAAAPAGGAPASAVAAAPAPRAMLSGPAEVSIGGPLVLAVEVLDAGGAGEGEVVLEFDASLLRGAGAQGNRLRVPLLAAGDGRLAGQASFTAAAAGTGQTSVRLVQGVVRGADGRSLPLAGGAAHALRIGL